MEIANYDFKMINEGYYFSQVKMYRSGQPVKLDLGERDTVFIDYTIDGVIISQKYIAAISANSQLKKVFVGVLGGLPTPVEMDELIGEYCIVRVEHNESKKTGIVFANVVEVLGLNDVDEEKIINKDELKQMHKLKAFVADFGDEAVKELEVQ